MAKDAKQPKLPRGLSALRGKLPVHPGRWFLRTRSEAYRLRKFLMMRRILFNWRDAWSRYGSGEDLPALSFRQGFVLNHHGPADEPISLIEEIFQDRFYQRHVREPKAGLFLDIGANIGCVTLDWLSRLPNISIHAYEPNPRAFALLAKNVQLNNFGRGAKIYNEAVGGKFGTAKLLTSGPSTVATAYGSARSDDSQIVTVPTVPLDEVLRRCGPGESIAFLKMDAEGAEADILEGASAASISRIERIILEYHDSLVPDAKARCLRIIAGSGFRYCAEALKHPGVGLIYAWRS